MKHVCIQLVVLLNVLQQATTCPSSCKCSTGIVNVECKSTTSSSLPVNIPTDARSLVIRYERLKTINGDVFKELPNLERLTIIGSNIYIITNSMFKNLNNLRSLFLNINILYRIEDNSFAGLNKLRELEIINSRVRKFSMTTFKGLTALSKLKITSTTNLQRIEYDLFTPTPQITSIAIINSGISEIDNRTFLGLWKLQSVKLDFNRLKVIQNATFSSLKRLYMISLKGNIIESIERNAFTDLDSIDLLDLSQNRKLTSLHFLTKLTNLKRLDLSQVKLSSVRQLLIPKRLYSLKMTCTDVPAVSLNLTGCFNMGELDLRANNLSSLTGNEFNDLIGLERLYLQDTHLVRLSLHLKQLKYLDLSGNLRLIVDNNTFAFLPKLNLLNLQRTNLKSMPPISNMKYLFTLKLSDNKIQYINSMGDISSLKYLQLDNNNLERIKPSSFAKLLNIISLDLSKNKMSEGGLPLGLFHMCKKLIDVNLSYNKITFLNDTHLLGVEKSLTALDVSSNKLTSFALHNTYESLTSLDLSRNSLEEIILGKRMSLETLRLDYNPYVCSCWTIQIFHNNTISNLTGRCYNPPWTRTINISNFKYIINPCVNGRCAVEGTRNSCKCNHDYTGRYCELLDACSNVTCANNATCVSIAARPLCLCSIEFVEKYSLNSSRFYAKHVCLDGSACQVNDSQPICICPGKFTGAACKIKSPCLNCNGRNSTCKILRNCAQESGSKRKNTVVIATTSALLVVAVGAIAVIVWKKKKQAIRVDVKLQESGTSDIANEE